LGFDGYQTEEGGERSPFDPRVRCATLGFDVQRLRRKNVGCAGRVRFPGCAARPLGLVVQRLRRREKDEVHAIPGCAARPWAWLCNAFGVVGSVPNTRRQTSPRGSHNRARVAQRTLGAGGPGPRIPHLYAEGVMQHSPGSRSAPWEPGTARAHPAPLRRRRYTTQPRVAQRTLGTGHGPPAVPRRGSTRHRVSLSPTPSVVAALRDFIGVPEMQMEQPLPHLGPAYLPNRTMTCSGGTERVRLWPSRRACDWLWRVRATIGQSPGPRRWT
jgi:hypothetical protein